MTLFAGMYVLNSIKCIDYKIVDHLSKSIARTQGEIDSYVNEKFAIIKWDFGAFGVPGFLKEENAITAITGEPYWDKTQQDMYSRFNDIEKMSEQLMKNNIAFLRSCQGNYSVCYYDASSQRLILAVDKLGVRPIYYVICEDILFFSSTLRILESILIVPKRFDLTAFIEKKIFGVPLGTKTKYCDIKVLRDGQYIVCNSEGMSSDFYFRWEEIKPTDKELELIKKECYKTFRDAVSIRSSRDSSTFALLSGGLDSRSVVSVLNNLGKKVVAFNFSLPGELDQVYGKKYAEHIGIEYHSVNRSMRDVSIWHLISDCLSGLNQNTLRQVKLPRLIFAGDGGSVGMGHVYLSRDLLDAHKGGGIKDAMEYFLSRRNLPDRIFNRWVKEAIQQIRRNSLDREMRELSSAAIGRDFYLFLLRNDQRRHLHEFWENIDLVQVEFLEPFYDARVLSLIASAPIEPFIGHRFYYDWLSLFPPDAKSVPWQSYPGHKPCPVEKDDKYISQWEKNKIVSRDVSEISYRKCVSVIFKKNFPYYIVNRFMLYAAIVAYKLKLKDTLYLFDIINSLYRDHKKCSNTRIEICQ